MGDFAPLFNVGGPAAIILAVLIITLRSAAGDRAQSAKDRAQFDANIAAAEQRADEADARRKRVEQALDAERAERRRIEDELSAEIRRLRDQVQDLSVQVARLQARMGGVF